MTVLDRAAGALRPQTPDLRPATPTAALLAALQAAGGSLLVVLVPVVVTWLTTASDRASWTSVLRLGTVLWLLGHRTPVAVDGGVVSLAPLGLLAVVCAALVVAARRLSRTLDPLADRIEAGASRAAPSAPGALAAACFVTGYAGFAGLAAALAAHGQTHADPVRAALHALVLATVCGAVGVAGYLGGGLRAVPGFVADLLPDALRRPLRPAAVALAVQAGAGALLLAVMLVVERDGVLSLHRVLHPGALGGAVLTLGQVLVLPNLAVWAASFLVGPGFALGSGTSVTPMAVSLGDLPALPVLGALPSPGAMPGVALLLLAVPVLAGAAAGHVLVRGTDPGRWRVVADALAAAVLAGLVAAAGCWLASGGVGPGRLGTAGPDPLAVGAVFAAEVALGALVMVGVRAGLPRVTRR